MKCSRCGLESEVEQAFSKERSWFGLRTGVYCPTCRNERSKRRALMWWAALAVAVGCMALIVPEAVPQIIFGLAVYLALLFPMICLHESAHAVVARALGLQVFAVMVGYGRTLFSGRYRGIRWEIRAVPWAGTTLISGRPERWFKLRMWLAILAGPAVHGIVLVVCLMTPFILGNEGTPQVQNLLNSLWWLNVVVLAVNLFPTQRFTPLGKQASDGWQLLRIPFYSRAECEEQWAGTMPGTASKPGRAGTWWRLSSGSGRGRPHILGRR